MSNGDLVVYFDETNFNLFCKKSKGGAVRGERAAVVLPASKGPNLQVQCAVSAEIGVVHYALHHGSIRMKENASFLESVYEKAKASPVYQREYAGKKIVIILDNAPARSQSEARVTAAIDLVLLRLGGHIRVCATQLKVCVLLPLSYVQCYGDLTSVVCCCQGASAC